MTAWIELLSRELAMLALLAALGSGPVALLHRSHDRATRLALAPAYGLALGMGVLVTGLWRIPGDKLVWIGLLPLVLASLAFWRLTTRGKNQPGRFLPRAFWRLTTRGKNQPGRFLPRDLVQVGVLVGVVLVALSWPLASEDTVGPIGGYAVADAVGYTAELIGGAQQSIHTIAANGAPPGDLTLGYWSGIAQGFQQIGFNPIEITLAEAMGLHATDVLAPFLIAVLAATALGIFAAVRMLTGTRSWLAVLAGALAAGPLFIQILTDGSQGAIVGQALLLPFALAFKAALEHRRWQDWVLAGLLAAGIQTGYPLFVPPVVVAAVVVLGVLLVRHRGASRGVVAGLAGMLGVAVVATPYAFSRNAEYWTKIAGGEFSYDTVPDYDLPLEKVVGWLAQTREFYELVPIGDAPVTAALVPLALIAVVVFGLVRFGAARWLLALVGAAALLALYTASSEDCSYCAQRNLLPTGPVLAALVGVGLVAVARKQAIVAGVLALGVVVWVGDAHLTASERQRNAAYQLDPQLREVVQELPATGAPIHLEGFGQGPKAPMEEPLAYHAANEQTDAPLSLGAFIDENKGQQYIGGLVAPPGPELRTDHGFVLTRHASVDSGRRTVVQHGAIALQERAGELDVTLEGGVNVAMTQIDPRGSAFLPGAPLELFVTGGSGAPAWALVEIEELGNVNVEPGEDLDARRLPGGRIQVCVQARGEPPGRIATIGFAGSTPKPPSGTYEEFEIPPPAAIGRVVSVRALQRDCSPLRSFEGS